MNCRYSDCQFSVTAWAKLELVSTAEAQRLGRLSRHRRVPRLDVVVVVPARHRLAGECGEEQCEEDEAEALLAGESPHQ